MWICHFVVIYTLGCQSGKPTFDFIPDLDVKKVPFIFFLFEELKAKGKISFFFKLWLLCVAFCKIVAYLKQVCVTINKNEILYKILNLKAEYGSKFGHVACASSQH
jgi:hypothetical protein